MRPILIALLIIILTSCTPIITSVPTKTNVPTDTYALPATSTGTVTPVPTATATLTSAATLTPTPIPIMASPLPTQLTIVPPLNPTRVKQQEEIKNTIQTYFELRYRALSVSPPVDIQQDIFGGLVSDGDDAKDFLAAETAKLAVERKWYELNRLRYAKYEYSLQYKDIVFGASAQTATVSLHEYFDIICEIAIENNSQNPSACAIGELAHEIILRNESNRWEIISDTYWDSWWRQFRKPGLSTNEILQNINLKMQKLETMPTPTP